MTKDEAIKYLQQLYPNGGHCWLDEQRIEAIDMAVKALQEESASKDLEVELEKYIKDHFTIAREQLDRFGIEEKDYMYSMDKSDMLSLVEHFTNWQKEQIMAKAIDAKLLEGHLIRQRGVTHPLHVGDKVKLIIIKEDLL